jgi:hypothetical protein
VAVWLLLREHPFLPFSFNFKGDCLLMQLKRDREQQRDRLRDILMALKTESGSINLSGH